MIEFSELLIYTIKDLIVVVGGGIFSFYISFKYVMPPAMGDTAIKTADAIVKHEKVQPWINKLKENVEKLEPFIDKLNEVDIQELVDMLKGLKVVIEMQNQNKPPPPPKPKEKT